MIDAVNPGRQPVKKFWLIDGCSLRNCGREGRVKIFIGEKEPNKAFHFKAYTPTYAQMTRTGGSFIEGVDDWVAKVNEGQVVDESGAKWNTGDFFGFVNKAAFSPIGPMKEGDFLDEGQFWFSHKNGSFTAVA
jgi:hypothetical protein